MKLFFCMLCADVIRPKRGKKFMYCACGMSSARLMQPKDITKCERMEIKGDALPFGLCSNHLKWAVYNWKHDRRTSFINTWTIDTTQKINDVMEVKV